MHYLILKIKIKFGGKKTHQYFKNTKLIKQLFAMSQNQAFNETNVQNQAKIIGIRQQINNTMISEQKDQNLIEKIQRYQVKQNLDDQTKILKELIKQDQQNIQADTTLQAKKPRIGNQAQIMMSQSSDMQISYNNDEDSDEEQDQEPIQQKIINYQAQNQEGKNNHADSIYQSGLELKAQYEQQGGLSSQNQSDWDLSSNKAKDKKSSNSQKVSPNQFHTYNHNFDHDIESEDQSAMEQEGENSEMNDEQKNNYGSGIYNTSKIYNEPERLSYINPTIKNQHGFYPKLQYNQYSMQHRNTDGKHLDQQFRRKFAKALLDKTRGQEKNAAMQIISRQSDKIKVYSNEVIIWMSIYKIVFQIQFEKSKRNMSQNELVREIQSRLIDYLNQHPNEKKYKFIKICNRTFRALNIKKTTGDYWLRQMFKKFQGKLHPNVNTHKYLQKLENKLRGDQPLRGGKYAQNFDDEDDFSLDTRSINKSYIQNYNSFNNNNYIQLRFQNRYANSHGQFPIDTKQRVIRKIDKIIESTINRIFSQKINQFCIDINEMKKWYLKFGKYQIFNPNPSFYHEQPPSKNRSMLSGMIPTRIPNYQSDTNNSGGVKRLQSQILNYIKINPNIERSKVYTMAINMVKRVQIKQLQNQEVFGSWFSKFLSNNCNVINNYVNVKQRMYNSGFQIPINSYHRPTNKEVLLYGNPTKRGLM